MIYLQIGLGLLLLFFLMTVMLYFRNRTLEKEIRRLQTLLSEKETGTTMFEDPNVPLKEDADDLSSNDEVLGLIEAGESIGSISEKLGIPANKIDLIVKFDKIKKEKHI